MHRRTVTYRTVPKYLIKITYEYRICILEESRQILTNGCRNNKEYITKSTNAHADRTRGR